MPLLHDDDARAAIRARVAALRPDMTPRWGRMSVDQMLWHVNYGLDGALGRATAKPVKLPLPLPRAIVRALVLFAPWPKGAPTMPELIARERYDFDAERARCLALVDEVGRAPIDAPWPVHPAFGPMSGRAWSRLQAKHLDHHLTQFGA